MRVKSFFTQSRALDGALEYGGFPASELAASYGTPLIVIDTDVLDGNIRALLETTQRYGVEAAYAGKALLITALAARLRATALYLDCCSLGEIVTGEAAQFPAERMYLHGCGKTNEELQAVVDGRVGRIVVDGFDELGRLAALSRAERVVNVVLRFNTGIEAHTHEFIRTGGENTKFGFALEDAERAFALIAAEPALQLVGVHAHVGSQILDTDPFIANLDVLMQLYTQARRAGHASLHQILVGGGFGIPMHPEDTERLDIDATLRIITERARAHAANNNVPAPQISVEPGRAIIAEAGTTLYRVIASKSHGSRRFIVVDGGMTDNPRPALYQAYHHVELASRVSTAPDTTITVCGRACENDQLVESQLPADIRPGDVLAMRTTGAYTFSMASNYNRFTRPAVVFAGNGAHALAVRRESETDILRFDVLQ